MKETSSAVMLPLMAVGVLLLGSGCETAEKYSLTYRLWECGDWRKFNEPAPNPKLALFEATNCSDVQVQYDALSESHSTVERRAFYLQQNEACVAAGEKPEWVKPSVADGMRPIRVLPTREVITNLPPDRPTFAVITNQGRGFTLYRPPESEATFDLPVYPETSGTPTHLLLTPLAVAGDTVMVGVVASVVGFLLWVQMGAPVH